jgi:hypothetical protein
MESIALFEEKVAIQPSDLSGRDAKGKTSSEEINIEELLVEKLAARLQGKCSLHGYVVPGSLQFVSKSMGYIENGRFTGDIVYHLQVEGKVLYPPDGTVLQARVEKMNQMGMFAVYEVKDSENPDSDSVPAIKVILPRDLHTGDDPLADEFNSVEPGDYVELEIKKSRFQVNDEFILCVGDFRKLLTKARPVPDSVLEEGVGEQTEGQYQAVQNEKPPVANETKEDDEEENEENDDENEKEED